MAVQVFVLALSAIFHPCRFLTALDVFDEVNCIPQSAYHLQMGYHCDGCKDVLVHFVSWNMETLDSIWCLLIYSYFAFSD